MFIAAADGLFPPVVSGVLLAAVLSAIMSTADSQLLVAASAVTHDLGVGGDDADDRVRRSRWVVVGISAAAVVTALYGSQEIFRSVLFAWTAVGSAFGPLLAVTVLWGRVPPVASLVAVAAGFFPAVAAYLHPATQGTVVERVLPFVLSLAVAVAGRVGAGRRAS